jgi:hypothetical protein
MLSDAALEAPVFSSTGAKESTVPFDDKHFGFWDALLCGTS